MEGGDAGSRVSGLVGALLFSAVTRKPASPTFVFRRVRTWRYFTPLA